MTRGRNQRGQELIELGIGLVGFMAATLGLLTFGHAWMAANMIAHAARDGARLAATWPDRGTCGVLTNTTSIQSTVQSEIATVLGGMFQVHVSQNPQPAGAAPCGTPSTPTVQVNVTGCVPWLFPIMPSGLGVSCNGQQGFTVNRTIVLDDEGLGYAVGNPVP